VDGGGLPYLGSATPYNAGDLENALRSRRALDELLTARRLWIEWLGEGRVRKLAVVAELG
jgi:hypothetical protein